MFIIANSIIPAYMGLLFNRRKVRLNKDGENYAPEMVQEVYDLLESRWDEWVIAKEIQQSTGIDPAQIRCMSNHTGLLISSVHGYKLTDYASKEEIEKCFEHLYSRIQGIQNHINTLTNYIEDR